MTSLALGGAQPAAPAEARIGPNAVLQLAHAVDAALGRRATRSVFAASGALDLLEHPPEAMLDERVAARLHRAAVGQLGPQTAQRVLRDAGLRTAAYLLANRIPRLAQAVLRHLPAPFAARLLLTAVGRNAWTFAGSGRFEATLGPPITVAIHRNPLAVPGCPWHGAVFEGLFRALVHPRATVRHTECCALGEDACRFAIDLPRREARHA